MDYLGIVGILAEVLPKKTAIMNCPKSQPMILSAGENTPNEGAPTIMQSGVVPRYTLRGRLHGICLYSSLDRAEAHHFEQPIAPSACMIITVIPEKARAVSFIIR